jgi:hypothetical protein
MRPVNSGKKILDITQRDVVNGEKPILNAHALSKINMLPRIQKRLERMELLTEKFIEAQLRECLA